MNLVTTGVDGLDEMLNGGIPENLITALIGPTGSGKTIMSLQFLYSNLTQGKKVIYTSAAHTLEELITNALNYGWDLVPYLKNKQLLFKKFEPVTLEFKANETHLTSSYLEELPEFLYSHKGDLVILDSITEFLMLCNSDIVRRSRLISLFQILKQNQSTALITAETEVDTSSSKFGIIEFIADGVITLRMIQSDDFSELIQTIQITKMRWTKHSREMKQYEITDNGIEVYSKYQVMMGVSKNGKKYTRF